MILSQGTQCKWVNQNISGRSGERNTSTACPKTCNSSSVSKKASPENAEWYVEMHNTARVLQLQIEALNVLEAEPWHASRDLAIPLTNLGNETEYITSCASPSHPSTMFLWRCQCLRVTIIVLPIYAFDGARTRSCLSVVSCAPALRIVGVVDLFFYSAARYSGDESLLQ